MKQRILLLLLLLQCRHLAPTICVFSPGILTSDSLSRLRTCVTERTVAATNQGRPRTEQTSMSRANTNTSK